MGSETVRALVKWAKGPDGTGVKDVPSPEPVSGEVVIRVQAASVCASDVHIYHDEFPCELPVILGHEFCGVVERLGEGVANVGVGDVVVSENNPDACGTCPACTEGYPNLCPGKRAIGFKRDGCFADHVRIPAHLLHKVPDGVSAEVAALSEPLAVTVHAVEDRCGIRDGDTVIVLGPGAIGLLAAQVARADGARRVIVAGTNRDMVLRLPCADGLGFETCNVEQEDLVERVMSLTNGAGGDVVVEASGAPPAVALGTRLLRRVGRMVVSGITGKPGIAVPWDDLVFKGATVHFAFSSRPRNWDKAMHYLAQGRVQVEPLVTHRFALDRWREAFGAMERAECLRALLSSEGNTP